MPYVVYGSLLTALIAGVLGMIAVRYGAKRFVVTTAFALTVAAVGVGVLANLFTPRTFLFGAPPMEAVLETDTLSGSPTVVVNTGDCLTLYRSLGPVSFATAHDLYPGGEWDKRPTRVCTARGWHPGTVFLPDSVFSGSWVLCDWDRCYRLVGSKGQNAEDAFGAFVQTG